MSGDGILLELQNLKTHFFTEAGVVRAVDGVTYRIPRGKTLGVVGESGCGKSMTALSILRLIPEPGKIVEGRVLFDGDDLSTLSEADMREIRGNRISMIFQEPMTSLNPVYTVGNQIAEAIILHDGVTKEEACRRTVELLDKVGIPSPDQRIDEYPHQMSGGMRQRVMIAMALACNPALLIADEPTTALDVTIQAQILELLKSLQNEFGMSILMITHDLGVIAETADEVVVMYAGKIVEYAQTGELFGNPMHPYSQGLFRSRPKLGMHPEDALAVIPGSVPNPLYFPSGCKFHPRCDQVRESCSTVEPELVEVKPGHWVSCVLYE